MDWQQPAALAVVAVTAGALLWRWLRPRRMDFRRRTGCGCGVESLERPPSVRVSGRRGERPQILVTER
ncbi:MAG: hypothetical protein KIT22_14175 [Verrucomicrobiae bacterium]|nr:hypothetical protein [Verrucomicrobiae bacterium]